jgi:hypothetical protein
MPEFTHDISASINALGAPDALELEPVPNVYPLWTYNDAFLALDATTVSGGVTPASPGLATRYIVLNLNRLIVRQGALKTSIRT